MAGIMSASIRALVLENLKPAVTSLRSDTGMTNGKALGQASAFTRTIAVASAQITAAASGLQRAVRPLELVKASMEPLTA